MLGSWDQGTVQVSPLLSFGSLSINRGLYEIGIARVLGNPLKHIDQNDRDST